MTATSSQQQQAAVNFEMSPNHTPSDLQAEVNIRLLGNSSLSIKVNKQHIRGKERV